MLTSNQIISHCRKGWDVHKGIKVALQIAASFRTDHYHVNHCSTFKRVSLKNTRPKIQLRFSDLSIDGFNPNLGGHDSTVQWSVYLSNVSSNMTHILMEIIDIILFSLCIHTLIHEYMLFHFSTL